MTIPRRLITTWICDPARDRYTDRHRDIFEACLRSWLRLMPDYDLRVVTLGNLYEFEHDQWIEARVAEGNFIGASQWARLSYLKHLGGIFLDADVEAVRRFDVLCDQSLFTVGHLGNGQHFANNAVMASPAYHPFLDVLRHGIRKANPADPEFGNHTGPFLLTMLLNKLGWSGADVEAVVHVCPGHPDPEYRVPVRVARSAVFHPYNWNQSYDPAVHVQPDTLAVHHWASSWRAPEKQPQHVWRT